MTKDIVKREIRFAIHLPKTDYREDTHYIRETVHYKDGTSAPNGYLVKNYMRPIWVTAANFRNHKEKKEFEYVDRLMMKQSTQSDLNRTVANLLGTPHLATNRNAIKDSPYLYGYDLSSTSLIKLKSLEKNNSSQSAYTVAFADIETNPGTGEVLLATITYGKKAHTSILAKFVKNIPDVQRRLDAAILKYLPAYTDLDISITICKTEVDLIKDMFSVANRWAPVFMSFWNMNYDIPFLLDRLKHYGVNPTTVMCDTSIPREYRFCRYKQGISKKVTASGAVKPINPSLQWHTLILTAPFYVIDSMCVYRQLRMTAQEEPSYSLDAILGKELQKGKLKFSEADGFSGLNWHYFMQESYPIEYIVYNIYDCLGMAELDAKTKDLSNSLPSYAAMSDFARFNSNPKKIVDAMFSFGLARGRVIGTVPTINKTEEQIISVDDVFDEGDDEDEEDDGLDVAKNKTLDLKDWIQTLPQSNLIQNGLQCLEDYPDVKTNIRGMVIDIDSVSSYPSCTQISNASKETCVSELIGIEGVTETVFREQNLSICLGDVNLLEYFAVMFDAPALDAIDFDEIDKYLVNL